MKSFLPCTLFLLFVSICYSQEPIIHSKIIYTDSIGKQGVYIAINDWFASSYNSANDVIQMADKEAGILIGNGNIEYYTNSSYDGWISYTIKVYCKDNRFKVELLNFTHKSTRVSDPTYSLGLLTSKEPYTDKGMFKKYHNREWILMKEKADEYSKFIFNELELKTENMESQLSGGNDW